MILSEPLPCRLSNFPTLHGQGTARERPAGPTGKMPVPHALRTHVCVLACGMVSQTRVSNAICYAKHRSRSHDAVIRVYDEAGNVIETHEHKGEFREW